jgi:hypothetical protein
VADQLLVVQAVASALRFRERQDRSLLEGVVAYLARRQMLLVLGNCEHVVKAVTRLLERDRIRPVASSALASQRLTQSANTAADVSPTSRALGAAQDSSRARPAWSLTRPQSWKHFSRCPLLR